MLIDLLLVVHRRRPPSSPLTHDRRLGTSLAVNKIVAKKIHVIIINYNLRFFVTIFYKRLRWPNPLRKSYNLGLLPLVKQFRIRAEYCKFGRAQLNWYTLGYFSVFTSLQDLGIDNLQTPEFVPNSRRYFEHLSQTLRFLALKEPVGSCRQILYFVGLFPNLQDLKLNYSIPMEEHDGVDDVALVPLSVPPLRGRLTLICFSRDKLTGRSLRWPPFSFHGPLHGDVRAAPFRWMCGNLGSTAVVSVRSLQ